MKDWSRLDSPKTTVGIVSVAYAAFLLVQLLANGCDFSAFVTAGDTYANPATAPDSLRILQDSDGYDGQFYYRLALTPFTNKPSDRGITLDKPAYRQQRIVYPLLARALSLGQPEYVPVSLVVVNVLALCVIAYVGSRYAQLSGLHAIWGLAFALFPGFLLTLSRDTAEIVEISFFLASVVCLRQNRRFLGTALLVLAALTKETALGVVLGIFLALVAGRDRTRWRALWLPAIAPILIYLLWHTWLTYNWSGVSATQIAVDVNFGAPFVGLSRFVLSVIPPTGRYERVVLIELLLVAAFVVAVIWAWRRSAAQRFTKVSWLLYTALMISLTQAVWVEDWAFLRLLSEFFMLGTMILQESQSGLRKAAFCASIASWLLLGLDVLMR